MGNKRGNMGEGSLNRDIMRQKQHLQPPDVIHIGQVTYERVNASAGYRMTPVGRHVA